MSFIGFTTDEVNGVMVEVFKQTRLGNMRLSERNTFIAVHVSEHPEQHTPVHIPPLDPGLAEYCKFRATRERNADSHSTLAKYIQLAQRYISHNDVTLRTLIWAKEVLSNAGLTANVAMVERQLSKFGRETPARDIHLATEALKLDSHAAAYLRRD